jgi:hypothetical protein
MRIVQLGLFGRINTITNIGIACRDNILAAVCDIRVLSLYKLIDVWLSVTIKTVAMTKDMHSTRYY